MDGLNLVLLGTILCIRLTRKAQNRIERTYFEERNDKRVGGEADVNGEAELGMAEFGTVEVGRGVAEKEKLKLSKARRTSPIRVECST